MSLRCPSCTAPVNGFMGRCPACGHDLVAGPPATATVFRRRWRWRVALALMALVAVLAVLGATGVDRLITRRPAGGPSALNRTGATLIDSLDALQIIDADNGHSRLLAMPAPAGGPSDGRVVRVGHGLILNRGGRAWLYRAGLRTAPVGLGPSLMIVPEPDALHVWSWGPDVGHVRLLDLTGRQVGAARAVPVGWYLTGDRTDAGLVLAPDQGGPLAAEIWDSSSNHVRRVFAGADPVAASGRWFAWLSGPCQPGCLLHLSDLQTGIDRQVALPAANHGPLTGTFSPDGTTLAVPLLLGVTEAAPDGGTTAMVVVDVASLSVALLPGSDQVPVPDDGAWASWSPTGWLLFSAYGATQILAWRPGLRRAVGLRAATLPPLPPPGTSGLASFTTL